MNTEDKEKIKQIIVLLEDFYYHANTCEIDSPGSGGAEIQDGIEQILDILKDMGYGELIEQSKIIQGFI